MMTVGYLRNQVQKGDVEVFGLTQKQNHRFIYTTFWTGVRCSVYPLIISKFALMALVRILANLFSFIIASWQKINY